MGGPGDLCVSWSLSMTTAENCQEQIDESGVCSGGNGGQNGLETEGGSRGASQSLPRDEGVGPEAGPQ